MFGFDWHPAHHHPNHALQLRDTPRQLLNRLTLGIREFAVFQHATFPPRAHYTTRNTHHGGIIRHRVDHHGAATDFDVVADDDAAQDFGARSYHDTVSQGGMPLSFFIPCSAQRHTLIEQNIIANLCGLPNDHTHAVIDEEAPADLAPG